MNKNLVSIVMNCHNGEKYLKDAINSIIKQSYNKWELIFFDNASQDNSAKIVKNYKDKRGLLRELSMEKHLKKRLIFSLVSKSKKNVLRGLHMQRKNMQGKYLSVLKGRILDVVVDCRVKSKNFGKHFGFWITCKREVAEALKQNFITY